MKKRFTTVDLRLIFENDPKKADPDEIQDLMRKWVDENLRGWFGAKAQGKATLSDGSKVQWRILHRDDDPEAWKDWFQS